MIRHSDDKRSMLYQEIGARLTRLRQRRGVLVADVVKAVGISAGSLQKVEEGMNCPMHTVALLADFYEVSIADIVPRIKELAA